MTTAAETLADFAIGMKYEDIPAEVIERAKDCVIDTVAACAFGAELPWTKTVIDYARRNSAPGECSVLGTPIKVRAPFACLANGAAAHAFELDALCEPSVGIHTRLLARAIVLRQGGQKYALAQADLGGLPYALVQEVASRIRATGIDAQHILLGATHSHSSVGAIWPAALLMTAPIMPLSSLMNW